MLYLINKFYSRCAIGKKTALLILCTLISYLAAGQTFTSESSYTHDYDNRNTGSTSSSHAAPGSLDFTKGRIETLSVKFSFLSGGVNCSADDVQFKIISNQGQVMGTGSTSACGSTTINVSPSALQYGEIPDEVIISYNNAIRDNESSIKAKYSAIWKYTLIEPCTDCGFQIRIIESSFSTYLCLDSRPRFGAVVDPQATPEDNIYTVVGKLGNSEEVFRRQYVGDLPQIQWRSQSYSFCNWRDYNDLGAEIYDFYVTDGDRRYRCQAQTDPSFTSGELGYRCSPCDGSTNNILRNAANTAVEIISLDDLFGIFSSEPFDCSDVEVPFTGNRLATDTTSGELSEVSYNYDVRVYPNPADTKTNISISSINDEETEIRVYDVNGNMVKEVLQKSTLNAGRSVVPLDVTNFVPGTYILRVNTLSGIEKTVRFIKK
ncbi:T9SS type A sorting domain-containing protein [Roseivirga sp. BDSF3-8]|uniref:T9SS type A sorting domain-containing protein n=1 Tax=Roseivirga sp. BDSF3-8 TaxID=3241598 RepID=UPI003531CEF1